MISFHNIGNAQTSQAGRFYLYMRIIICDDNYSYATLLHDKIIDYFAKIDKICVCEVFCNPQMLLKADLSTAHVIFLDVDMPELNGIETARKLRESYPDIFIVFITVWIEYAPDGYYVNAFRYLLKQRLESELPMCLEAIRDKLSKSQEHLQFQGSTAPFEIALHDILYFEGSSYRMVRLHTIGGNILEFRGKLADIEKSMSTKGFLRIQNSFIVNMQYLIKIKGYQAHMKDGTTLKTATRNYAEICNRFLIWKGQRL